MNTFSTLQLKILSLFILLISLVTLLASCITVNKLHSLEEDKAVHSHSLNDKVTFTIYTVKDIYHINIKDLNIASESGEYYTNFPTQEDLLRVLETLTSRDLDIDFLEERDRLQ